jgi:hypothetical protein
MNSSEKYQFDVMYASIEQCKAAIKVAEEGKVEVNQDLSKCANYLAELESAKRNLKESNAVVSMFEFAMIKKEIEMSDELIRQQELKINNLNNLIRDRSKEMHVLAEKLEAFSRSLEKGKILTFRGKNG